MKDYAAGTPVGKNQVPLFDSPAPYKAVKQYVNENATASSVISVTHDTTAIEVATGGTAAVMRWIATSDTQASVVAIAGSTANFDHVVAANTVRRFVIPIEANPASTSSVQGVNRQEGLYQRVAIKTQGIASVFLSEYGSSNSY